MAISMHNILNERKYPFGLALSALMAFVTFLLLTNNTSTLFPYLSISAFKRSTPVLHSSSLNTTAPEGNPTVASSINDSLLFEKSPPAPSVDDEGSGDHNVLTDMKVSIKNDLVGDSKVSTSNESVATVDGSSPPSVDDNSGDGDLNVSVLSIDWVKCPGPVAVDYIPCLDNMKAIKRLKSRRHMEHRERHCPKPSPRCLVPLPKSYKVPLPWPKSRDMIWYDNVPHPKLVEYKKNQNWVRKSGPFFEFPGGGTQFSEGVSQYFNFIEETLPDIEWGKHVRVVLDVGCGVASFGGYLMEKGVITMSFAPKDEHEAQIQFALERGIPATLAVIATQKLTFPSNAYDLIHCARCRVHWNANGGKALLELNRVLRPGGYFIWSATPVYQHDPKHLRVWNEMVALTKSMCWEVVAEANISKVGFVIYRKPDTHSCYNNRTDKNPPLCEEKDIRNISMHVPLSDCLPRLPVDSKGYLYTWPSAWPERLNNSPQCISIVLDDEETFDQDTKQWAELVSDAYLKDLAVNWSAVRNVMDMNAGYGGFAAALFDLPLWVMNVIPIEAQDTLSVIFDRGLIGIYHDWCESFNTYPRSYDLLHSNFLLTNLTKRCDLLDVVVEMDRILRPGGYLVVQDTREMFNELNPVLLSLHWSTKLHRGQFLVGKKGFWRP